MRLYPKKMRSKHQIMNQGNYPCNYIGVTLPDPKPEVCEKLRRCLARYLHPFPLKAGCWIGWDLEIQIDPCTVTEKKGTSNILKWCTCFIAAIQY